VQRSFCTAAWVRGFNLYTFNFEIRNCSISLILAKLEWSSVNWSSILIIFSQPDKSLGWVPTSESSCNGSWIKHAAPKGWNLTIIISVCAKSVLYFISLLSPVIEDELITPLLLLISYSWWPLSLKDKVKAV